MWGIRTELRHRYDYEYPKVMMLERPVSEGISFGPMWITLCERLYLHIYYENNDIWHRCLGDPNCFGDFWARMDELAQKAWDEIKGKEPLMGTIYLGPILGKCLHMIDEP
jgi:hypothetical protein